MQATEVVISALVAVENSQPEVARLLLDVAAAIVQAGQVRVCNQRGHLLRDQQCLADCWSRFGRSSLHCHQSALVPGCEGV